MYPPEGCPFCHSTDVDYGFVEVNGDKAEQDCTCLTCDRSWFERYKYEGYEEITQ